MTPPSQTRFRNRSLDVWDVPLCFLVELFLPRRFRRCASFLLIGAVKMCLGGQKTVALGHIRYLDLRNQIYLDFGHQICLDSSDAHRAADPQRGSCFKALFLCTSKRCFSLGACDLGQTSYQQNLGERTTGERRAMVRIDK